MGAIAAPPIKRPNLYLPDGWDTTWKAAKAASATTPAWVALHGDSNSQGSYASDGLVTPFFPKLRAALVSKYGLYSDYQTTVFSDAMAASTVMTYATLAVPWVLSAGGGVATYPNAVDWGQGTNFNGGTPTAVYTTPAACTSLWIARGEYAAGTYDILVTGANAGSTAAAVGGGTAVTTSYAGGVLTITVTSTTTRFGRKILVSGLDNTTHVCTWQNQSASYVIQANAVAPIYSTTGIGFANNGRSGLRAADYLNSASNRMSLTWSGKVTVTPATAPVLGFPAQAHLSIVALGINDCATAANLATSAYEVEVYQHDLVDIIRAIRRGRANASIMILSTANPDAIFSDMTTPSFANAIHWDWYARAALTVAQQYNCAFADVHARWGETPVGSGFVVSATNSHISDAGHTDIYNFLQPVIV